MNITPLHERVLVRRLEEKETAEGGIIIPDAAKEKPQEGEVMAIGAGKIEKDHRIPLDVNVGDRILFGKYTGNDINHRRPGVPDPPGGRNPREGQRDRQSGIRQEVGFTRTEDFGRGRSAQSPGRVRSNGKTNCNW